MKTGTTENVMTTMVPVSNLDLSRIIPNLTPDILPKLLIKGYFKSEPSDFHDVAFTAKKYRDGRLYVYVGKEGYDYYALYGTRIVKVDKKGRGSTYTWLISVHDIGKMPVNIRAVLVKLAIKGAEHYLNIAKKATVITELKKNNATVLKSQIDYDNVKVSKIEYDEESLEEVAKEEGENPSDVKEILEKLRLALARLEEALNYTCMNCRNKMTLIKKKGDKNVSILLEELYDAIRNQDIESIVDKLDLLLSKLTFCEKCRRKMKKADINIDDIISELEELLDKLSEYV